MEENLDLLSIGDASLDVFITPSESETFCNINDKDCFICFTYGDKIPVKTLDFSIGGNAANNAVGTRRLGVRSACVLTIGQDDIGNQIVSKLKAEGVDTTFVIQQPSVGSNYSTVISYSGERTIFTHKVPRSYEFPVKLPRTPWVYLTSMGDSFRPFYNHLIEWLKKNDNTRLAFNPGSRQLRAGFDAIKDVFAASYVVFVNRREAEGLTGFKGSQGKEKELLKKLSDLGPRISIVTDGGNGSFVYDGESYYKCGILPIDACERTGAGDAFGSGFLSAIIKGKSIEEALITGTTNSASVIGYVGSQKGLLKEQEMQEWLQRAKSSEVEAKKF